MSTSRRRAVAAMVASVVFREGFAQAPGPLRRLGYLSRTDDGSWFRPALANLGHVEGVNLKTLVRNAEDGAATEAAAAELVRQRPDVLFTPGEYRTVVLAKLTRTIPIVCGSISDPVRLGLAKSLRRPGGNVTGFAHDVDRATGDSAIAMIKWLLPRVRRIVVVLVAGREGRLKEGLRPMAEAAVAAGFSWEYVSLGPLVDYERVFAGIPDKGQALAWLTGFPKEAATSEVTAFFNRLRIATLGGGGDDWVRAGALVSHERNLADPERRLAAILDKVLRGGNPAEIPFEVPDRTEMVFNRTTARILGVPITPEVLLRVTEMVD